MSHGSTVLDRLLADDPRLTLNFLDGYRLRVSIGIHDFEKAEPQMLNVDVTLACLYDGGVKGDGIEHVVDYDFIRTGIARLVEGRHFNLQETLADEIAALCLRPPEVVAAVVSTAKPDVYPDCAAVGCVVFRRK